MKRPITIATWDYDRVRAIIDGRVPVEGCDVNYIPLAPEECFHRTYLNREFDVAEIGFSPYLIALSRGAADYVALPIFLSRMYRHSAIYIRTDRGIDTPAGLRGKRVGVPEYQMSAAMWARGMLHDDHGVAPDAMRWFRGGLEVPGRTDKFPLNLPPDFPLQPIPDDATLSAMLANGELDALFSARAPSCYGAAGVPVARLYENFADAEREYARRTRIFPIMHALGVRRDVLDDAPWLAMSLMKAFIEAKRIADADLFEVTALKIGLPWIVDEAQRTRALLGEDFWPYGVGPNRHTLETMARYSFAQGLATRQLGVDEMFAATTIDSTVKV
jgi:4,5-dihydroxyphthalate decarboxylase